MTKTTSNKNAAVVHQTMAQLMSREWPTPEDVIGPWLKQGESCFLWAATGAGKTMLSLTLALLVAGGGEMAGWTAQKPRKVVYIDGEMRTADLVERAKFLGDSIKGFDPDTAWANLEVHSRQDQRPEVEFYNICDPETQDAICDHLRKSKAELVILDNLTTLAKVVDENDSAAMGPLLDFMHKLKRDGIAAILVHHGNKTGKAYRGSTAMVTTFEVVIGLVKPENATFEETVFSLTFEKFRGKRSEAIKPRVFSLDGSGWQAKADDGDDVTRLLRAIETCEFTNQQEAGASLKFDKTKTSKLLARAKKEGRITAEQLKACFEAAFGDEDVPL